MDDKCFEKDAYYRQREAKRESKRAKLDQSEQPNAPPAAVKPARGPCAKWTPGPHCSHSAHLCVPLPGSLPAPSPLSQKMDAENPFCPTNQIILYCHFPSPLCHSLPLYIHLTPSLSFSAPCLLLPRSPCPSQNRIYSVMKAGVHWFGEFPHR